MMLLLMDAACPPAAFAAEWRTWRGPSGNGTAEAGQSPPTAWSDSEGVLWKTPVPGRGHSTPIVTGNLVVLTTADETAQVQSVIAYDRTTGAEAWRRDVHRGGFVPEIHKKNTQATPSACGDGERIFAVFHNGGRIHLTALDLEGSVQWTKDTGAYRCHYGFGYAPSPVLAGENLIVTAEFEEAGYLAAFDRATGAERWRTPRPIRTSYSTPALATLAGREQLLLTGDGRLCSYDPGSGRELWSTEAVTKATCGTPVWEGSLIFASGGFPNKETAAVRADGSGEVVWKNTVKCYEQSLLVHEGHVYAFDDGGILHCLRAEDGRECWKKRLGGPVSASPVLAGGLIYLLNERGIAYVVKPNPAAFELVAENHLGDESFASPVICGSVIYLRVAFLSGENRQEWLYAIGEKAAPAPATSGAPASGGGRASAGAPALDLANPSQP